MSKSIPKSKQRRTPRKRRYSPPLDPGIRRYVEVLNDRGIETFESCEGGKGHSYPEPTVRFHGDRTEGFRAFAIAQQHAFPVYALRRTWSIDDGEPSGPYWELVFYINPRSATDGE